MIRIAPTFGAINLEAVAAPDCFEIEARILALSNPNAEIRPEEALAAGAAFAVDGKMVNNALAFPGIFRGALDARARRITDAMQVAAAEAIAAHVRTLFVWPLGTHSRMS